MNQKSEFTPGEIYALVIVGAATIVGIYGLSKLAVELTREGIRTIKEKKSA